MAKVNSATIVNLGGVTAVQKIIDDVPCEEAKWYVNEISSINGKNGYYADNFIVGIHNPHTHFKIEDLKAYLADLEQK
ncbi:hypothetical protein [Acinetobacter venetianus]|uniref:hypothetical protein n=1 Tax=Acinetobacter venetianus TaxID=52133 RepID=UPI003A943B64